MSKKSHGPSLYYATDKNVFDALNQHKVDTPTVMGLFQSRNIIVGKKNSREELAKYFSRLTHDYYDHKTIADRLGVAPRRERITTMDIVTDDGIDDIKIAVDAYKKEIEASGDVVHLTRDGDSLMLNIQYTTVDYKKSEFSQVQVRDGTIEFIKTTNGYTVRNTENEHLTDARDTLFGKIEKTSEKTLEKKEVSLEGITSHNLRSKFFHELMLNLPGFTFKDATSVYVYKAKPDIDEDDEDEVSDAETHVERVALRGNGLSRSEILNGLLEDEDFYIVKVGWKAKEDLGTGHAYDIEATFTNPKDCIGFSFIVSGVYPYEDGVLSSRRRIPTRSETTKISHVVEAKSRDLVKTLQDEYEKGME